MSKKFAFLFATALLCFFLLETRGGAAEPERFECWVSPLGNDEKSGGESDPFLTPDRARRKILESKAAGQKGAWTVHLAAGEYPMTGPLTFSSEDSGSAEAPILWRGADDGQTVLTGGIELSGWKEEGEFWSCPLPIENERPLYFEQLFVNGRRATRARYPDEGFLNPAEIREASPMDKKTRKPIEPTTEQTLVAKEGELALLTDIPAEELRFGQLVIHHHWDTTRRILLGYDSASGTLRLQGAPMKAWNPWRTSSLYYIENVRTAFNRPGEWFYDGVNRRVLYRPREGESLTASRMIAPRSGLTRLLTVAGKSDAELVTDLQFEKIAFSHTDSPRREPVMKNAALPEEVTGPLNAPGPSQFEPAQAASFTDSVLFINRAERVAFRDCEISHTGEYGVWFQNTRKCRMEHSILTDLGAGGIRLGGSAFSERNVLDNNLIRSGGRFHASAVAVWIGNNTIDNRITHNDIGDFFYTGVSAGWNWGYKGVAFRNRIEFNRIHKIGQGAMADMGGVYTLGTSHGTRVCNNVIFDIKSYGYGGWGLYTDEGSEGILMENNLVYDTTDGSFHQHYGRGNLIRNNILVNSRPHQIAATRVEPHLSFTFENNIVYWTEGTAFGYNIGKVDARIHSNLWWREGGETEFGGKTHDAWTAEGHDLGGMAADPLFENVAEYDFRLKPDSPAFKIGFVPFDYSRAGLYGDQAWREKGAEEPTPAEK